MSLFAGIDYDSSWIHIVLLPETDDRATFTRLDLASGPGSSFERARRVRDLMPARGRWADEGILAIGIEEPWTKQLNSLVAHIRVQGALLACLPRDIRITPFPPNRLAPEGWKALTVGKTTASKEDVARWARSKLCTAYKADADLGWPQDAYDAFAIAWATRHRWETAERNRRAA